MVEPQAVEEKRLRFQGPEFGSRKRHKCKGANNTDDLFKLTTGLKGVFQARFFLNL